MYGKQNHQNLLVKVLNIFLIKEEVNGRSFIESTFVTGQGFVMSKT